MIFKFVIIQLLFILSVTLPSAMAANSLFAATTDCLITEIVTLLDSTIINQHEKAKLILIEKFQQISFRNGAQPFSSNEQEFYNLIRNLVNPQGKINEWVLDYCKNISLGESPWTPSQTPSYAQSDNILKLPQDLNTVNLNLSKYMQDLDAVNLNLSKYKQDLDALNLTLSNQMQDLDAVNLKLSKYMTMTPINPIEIPATNGAHSIPGRIPQSATHVLLWCTIRSGRNPGEDEDFQVKFSNSLGHKYIFYYHLYQQDAWSYNSDNIWMEVCPQRIVIIEGLRSPPISGNGRFQLHIAGYK